MKILYNKKDIRETEEKKRTKKIRKEKERKRNALKLSLHGNNGTPSRRKGAINVIGAIPDYLIITK